MTTQFRRVDGILVADRTPSKGEVTDMRVFYDEFSARAHANKQRRTGRSSRTFSRSVKAGSAELALWVVVTRSKTEA